MLVVENVSLFYDRKKRNPVLENVSFTIEKAHSLGIHIDNRPSFGLMCPSGCGKSTLLRAISGLHPY